MRLTILIYSFFWVLATGLQTQDHASLTGTITDLGKPVSDATITLKGYKDENCAKLANKEDRVAQEEKGLAACESESGQVTTDDKGGYSFPDLKPGWYNMRLLFTITAPPAPVYAPVYDSMMCPSVEWGVVFLSPKEAMGKYNGFAQSVFFNLKKKQARRIDFNYEKKTGENPECFAQGSLVPDSGRLAKTESLVLSMPGTKSSLSLMPGPSAWEIDFHPKDALVFLDAKGRADHLLITAFLKKVPFEATAESCRAAGVPGRESAVARRPRIPGPRARLLRSPFIKRAVSAGRPETV